MKKPRKFIVEIQGKISDQEAMVYCIGVMRGGRISKFRGKDQYCFHTKFWDGVHVSVFTRPDVMAERFVISR